MSSNLVRPCIRCTIRESIHTDPTWLPICEECESEISRLPHDEMIKEQARCWQLFDSQRLGYGVEYPELEKEVVWRAENPSGNFRVHRTTVDTQIDTIERTYKQTAFQTDYRTQSARQIVGEIMSYHFEEPAVIVTEDNELVGIAVYRVYFNEDMGTKEARIAQLASFRPGVGRTLVQKVEQIAREESCDLVTLSYGPGAREFYEKLGYTTETRYPSGEAENLMVKFITNGSRG